MDPKTRADVIATLRKMKREDLVKHVEKQTSEAATMTGKLKEFFTFIQKAHDTGNDVRIDELKKALIDVPEMGRVMKQLWPIIQTVDGWKNRR